MTGKRAFFTPSPEAVPTLLARVFYAPDDERPGIEFLVEEETDSEATLPNLSEVTIFPITEICATAEGFVIRGTNERVLGKIATLTVDIQTEPPVAIYTEEEK